MLIGDYFAEISRLVHDHETAGFIQSSDFLTEARSDDLGRLPSLLPTTTKAARETFDSGTTTPLIVRRRLFSITSTYRIGSSRQRG